MVDGVPVLIHEANSLFTVADFAAGRATTFQPPSRLRRLLGRAVPSLSKNHRAAANYARLAKMLKAEAPQPRVLVLGGSILGQGMEVLADDPAITLAETDVAWGPRTALIADAHDIPFADGTFDGVIAQAVLEHVVDPARCVAEMCRVLRPGGLVYAETPFMQQVHMGRYDFARYTPLGHRRLFRQFEEIASGASSGPGMALAWAWQYWLTSWARRKAFRALLAAAAGWTAWPLKYLDRWLLERPGAYDAASATYFLGRKSERTLSDRELIGLYRGAL